MGNASSILVYPSGDDWVRRDAMIGLGLHNQVDNRGELNHVGPQAVSRSGPFGHVYPYTSDEHSQTGDGARKAMTRIGETTRCQRNRVVRSSIEVYGFFIW